MDIYPAIDIKGGRVARVAGAPGAGDPDPLAQASALVAEGARWLHVVDMDRAFRTGGENTEWIRRICTLPGVAVQVGGNLVEPVWVIEAIQAGAARVVLGTAAALDQPLLERLVAATGPERAALAIEVRRGRVVRRGRGKPVAALAVELARHAADRGVSVAVHRDLDRDGLLAGADLDGAAALAALGIVQVIAAGGVGTVQELRRARQLGLAGVIVGRALHEGRFTLEQALACSR